MTERNLNIEFWSIVRFNEQDDRDPIELAAADFRIVQAAKYLVEGEVDGKLPKEHGYTELLAVIHDEYLLTPEEINTAMDISEERIARGYQS